MNRYSGWFLVITISLFPVVRWFQINSSDLAFSSGYTFFSMVGRLAGLIGIVLYSINFILSTRLKFLEYLFGGLNRVYIAHHIIGGAALISLLLHPLMLAFRFVPGQMRAAAEFLLPDISAPIDWAINYGQVAFVGMVLLLLITFYVKLPYQLWLFTHKFLGLAFFFGGLHALYIPSDISIDSLLRRYILSVVFVGMIAFIYRTLLSRIFVRHEKYVVKRVENPSEKVINIVMQPTKHLVTYKPGQFIFINFEQDGIGTETHPFSISSSPSRNFNDPDSIELSVTVKALGDYTSTLMQLKPGTIANIEGAFGRFTNTRYREPKQIWIAGGIGVTPFLSMAKSLVDEASKRTMPLEIHMFYVVRSKSELLQQDILKKLASIENLNFHYYTYIGEVEKRLISADIINEAAGGLKNTDIFICGPPPMMVSLKHQFIDFRVKKRKIHTEEFSIS
jgi:predicted ferric reductase